MNGFSMTRLAGLAAIGFSIAATAMPAFAAEPSHADLNAVARCAVSKDRDALARAVRALPLTSDAVQIDAARLGDAASCVSGGAFEGPAMIVRGAVAQAFYFVDFREVGMEPRTPVRNFADLGWPAIGDDDPGVALFKLGDCVARNDADNVDKLMRAPYGSAAAKKLVALLSPYYTACYPKGAEISASRDTLQAAIAQGAYYAGVRYWKGQLNMVQKVGSR